jgi:hypothetical protein
MRLYLVPANSARKWPCRRGRGSATAVAAQLARVRRQALVGRAPDLASPKDGGFPGTSHSGRGRRSGCSRQCRRRHLCTPDTARIRRNRSIPAPEFRNGRRRLPMTVFDACSVGSRSGAWHSHLGLHDRKNQRPSPRNQHLRDRSGTSAFTHGVGGGLR